MGMKRNLTHFRIAELCNCLKNPHRSWLAHMSSQFKANGFGCFLRFPPPPYWNTRRPWRRVSIGNNDPWTPPQLFPSSSSFHVFYKLMSKLWNPQFFKTVNDMFISFFPFFFLFFIYLLMIVGINITFYLDSYLFKSLALFFCHRADRICLPIRCRSFKSNLKKNGNICYNAGTTAKSVSWRSHFY